jgi:hypothetical protein
MAEHGLLNAISDTLTSLGYLRGRGNTYVYPHIYNVFVLVHVQMKTAAGGHDLPAAGGWLRRLTLQS